MQSPQQSMYAGYPQQYYPPPASQAPSNQIQAGAQSYWQPPSQPPTWPQQRRRSRFSSIQSNRSPQCMQSCNFVLASLFLIYGFVTLALGIKILDSIECYPYLPRNSMYADQLRRVFDEDREVNKYCVFPFTKSDQEIRTAHFFYLSPITGHAIINQFFDQFFESVIKNRARFDHRTVGTVMSMILVPLYLDMSVGIFMIVSAVKSHELLSLFASIFLAVGTILDFVSIYILVQFSQNKYAFQVTCQVCLEDSSIYEYESKKDVYTGMACILHLVVATVRLVGVYAALAIMEQARTGGSSKTGARVGVMTPPGELTMQERPAPSKAMTSRPSVMMGSTVSPYIESPRSSASSPYNGSPRGSVPVNNGMEQRGSAVSPAYASPRGSFPPNNGKEQRNSAASPANGSPRGSAPPNNGMDQRGSAASPASGSPRGSVPASNGAEQRGSAASPANSSPRGSMPANNGMDQRGSAASPASGSPRGSVPANYGAEQRGSAPSPVNESPRISILANTTEGSARSSTLEKI